MVEQLEKNVYIFQKEQKINKITKVINLKNQTKFDFLNLSILLETLTSRIKSYDKHEFKLQKALNYDVDFNGTFKEINNNILISLEVSFLNLGYFNEDELKLILNFVSKIFNELCIENKDLKIKVEDYTKYLEKISDKQVEYSKYLLNDMVYKNYENYASYKEKIEYLKNEEAPFKIIQLLDLIKGSENYYYYIEGSIATYNMLKKSMDIVNNKNIEVYKEIPKNISFEKELRSELNKDNQVTLMITYQVINLKKEEEYVLKLLNMIIGGSSFSKLFINVREAENICYSIYSQDKIDYGIDIIIEVDKSNLKLAKEKITEQIKSIQNGNIEEEFPISKSNYIANIKSSENKGYFQKMLLDRKIIMKYNQYCAQNIIKQINDITKDDIINLCNRLEQVKVLEIT